MNYFRKKGFLYVISTYFVAYSNAKRQNVYCERFLHVVKVRVYGYKNKKNNFPVTLQDVHKKISAKRWSPLRRQAGLKPSSFILSVFLQNGYAQEGRMY